MSSPGVRRSVVGIFSVLVNFGCLFWEMRGCGSQNASLLGPLETARSESENIKTQFQICHRFGWRVLVPRVPGPGSVRASGLPGSPALFSAAVGSPPLPFWLQIYKFLCKLYATDHSGPLHFLRLHYR